MPASRVEESPRLVGPDAGVSDAHPRADRNTRTSRAPADVKRRPGQILTVERSRDPHGAGEASRPVEARPRFESGDRLPGAYENGVPEPGSFAGHVEAIVHAVDEKYICVPLLPEERSGAPGEPRPRMARQVGWSAICFRFDDSRDERLTIVSFVHEEASDELSCHDESVAGVPQARQPSREHRSKIVAHAFAVLGGGRRPIVPRSELAGAPATRGPRPRPLVGVPRPRGESAPDSWRERARRATWIRRHRRGLVHTVPPLLRDEAAPLGNAPFTTPTLLWKSMSADAMALSWRDA